MNEVVFRVADAPCPPPSLDEVPSVRCLKRGAGALSSAELLSILVARGSGNRTALGIAVELLQKFGSLRNLSRAGASDISKSCAITITMATRIVAAIELSRRFSEEEVRQQETLNGADDAYHFLKTRLRDIDHEVFSCIFLNHKHGVISYRELFRGSINSSLVHPRELLKEALRENAAAVILCHNHPSGHVSPSPDDLRLTEELQNLLLKVDIRVIDHLIVGGNGYFSFAKEGLLMD